MAESLTERSERFSIRLLIPEKVEIDLPSGDSPLPVEYGLHPSPDGALQASGVTGAH